MGQLAGRYASSILPLPAELHHSLLKAHVDTHLLDAALPGGQYHAARFCRWLEGLKAAAGTGIEELVAQFIELISHFCVQQYPVYRLLGFPSGHRARTTQQPQMPRITDGS